MKLFTELLKTHKDKFVKKETRYQKIEESGGFCETCWYPSEYGYVEVEEIDWEALDKAIEDLEKSFQLGGENAGRNPLVKGDF